MIIANATRLREATQRLALIATLSTTAWGCAHAGPNNVNELLYVHRRIHVDRETAARWDASERLVQAEGDRIAPIPADDKQPSAVPFPGDARATLTSLHPSDRHGATDKRILSVMGERKTIVSSGVVAQVTLVKGIEYKSEAHFQKGWLPVAIVVLPDSSNRDAIVYPKLKLHGGTSWVYVREASPSKWEAALVRLVDGKVEQEPLPISIAQGDDLEPVIGARFNWEDDDESVWTYCGGRCCRIGGAQ
ncbi:MAG: hypothetical protein M3Y05_04225 [Gemmatimonadota bacterium]|nr:hypothetical protein [Gemmatimonadota bacterium]